MALGDYNNGRTEKNDYRPTIYASGYANPDGHYEKTNLSFSIWKGILKATIAPKINGGSADDYPRYDKENSISVYINTSKAKVFLHYLREFKDAYLKDSTVAFNKGISVNTGLIMISNSNYIDGNGIPTITIIKPNSNGIADKKYSYEIKFGTEFGIINYDASTGKYETENDVHAAVELELIINQFEQYIIGQSYGVAAACVDSMFFENNHIRQDIGKIAQKLGVDLYTRSNYTKNSYFTSNGNSGNNGSVSSSSTPKTYSDIDTAFDD